MIITRTPLRISLAGGGTDIPPHAHDHGGMVVSMAINKYVWVMVNGRFSNDYRLSYTQTETTENPENLQHDLIRECIKAYSPGPVEIVTMADIPAGTGLGSSGAVTVGTLLGLDCYLNGRYTGGKLHLAELASKIEIERLKRNSGYQDQYASAYGGINTIYFYGGDTQVEPLPHGREIADRLMVFYTGKTRDAKPLLKTHKNAPLTYLEAQEEIAKEMKKAVLNKNFNYIGHLLDRGWQLKKDLKGVTNPEIDLMYSKAANAGAFGGKVCGAGGGGFLVLYVPFNKQTAVRLALMDYQEVHIRPDYDGATCIGVFS